MTVLEKNHNYPRLMRNVYERCASALNQKEYFLKWITLDRNSIPTYACKNNLLYIPMEIRALFHKTLSTSRKVGKRNFHIKTRLLPLRWLFGTKEKNPFINYWGAFFIILPSWSLINWYLIDGERMSFFFSFKKYWQFNYN